MGTNDLVDAGSPLANSVTGKPVLMATNNVVNDVFPFGDSGTINLGL